MDNIKFSNDALFMSPPQSPTTTNINKSKTFVSLNLYAILAPHESESVVIDDNDIDGTIKISKSGANTYH
jgi:hypothetical protein